MSCVPDVLMDPLTEDLPDFTRHDRGIDIIAQRVRVRLLTHLGDWPLKTTVGIDWVGFLATKPFDLDGLTAAIALEVADTPGVTDVQDLESVQSGDTVTVTATVLTVCGDLRLTVSPQDADGNLSIVVGGVLGHSARIVP